ncbi:MAG: alpha/beta hydrolase [Pseudomonadota bacterium]
MRLDEAYSNSRYIPGGEEFPERWAAAAAAFRASRAGASRLGLAYGPGERNWYDLHLPDRAPEGLAVFIHGGYWMAFSPRDFSHLAAGALARGWAVAMPAYTLAPAARIFEITREVAAAVTAAAGPVDGPIVVTGHSAGGHLSARMACEGVLPEDVADRLVNVVPISPLSDLGPLRETTMNETLRIDAEEVLEESPAFLLNIPDLPVHVWVGGAERPAFLDQARWLGEAWGVPVTVETDRHHFDVIGGLERAESLLMGALLGGR